MQDSPRSLSIVREPRPPERLAPLFRGVMNITPEYVADLLPWMLTEARTVLEQKRVDGTAEWCAREFAELASLMEQFSVQWKLESRGTGK